MGPPLPPVAAGYALSKPAPIKVELFLDLVCPFSRKMWGVITSAVLAKYGGPCEFRVHQVPQPWHPAGAWVHEAALAVQQVAPDKYVPFVDSVYAEFDKGRFKDDDTWSKTRPQVYDELLDLAASAGAERSAVAAVLAPNPGGGNAGTGATQALKWAVKFHRCRGVHVTPTVHVNGLEAGIISSGWTADQWCAFLEPMGADNFQGTKL